MNKFEKNNRRNKEIEEKNVLFINRCATVKVL